MNSINNVLSIKNLSKVYHSLEGETVAIDDVSFELNEGEFITIVGPSGCGKSSILNMICGLDKDYKGDILLKDNIKCGYMLQSDLLFDWLSIYDNALLGVKISKNLNKENILYVEELLKKYGLYEFKDKYPSSLSGGMKQRVALIRTLATKPDILILDEAFSALDYQTRLKVSDDVYNIIKSENKTVLMVSHDIAEAISMSNKIIVLSKRPSYVKKIYNIELTDKSTPINNRKAKEFAYYYDLLWKEIDSDE